MLPCRCSSPTWLNGVKKGAGTGADNWVALNTIFPFSDNLLSPKVPLPPFAISKNPFRASWIFMDEMQSKEELLFCNTSIPFKNASSSITTATFGTCMSVCVSVPVCVCCSDINRFSFVVPFDSHSGWGRQINDDGNIYDIATATAVVRIMNGLCSSTHQALGQQGTKGPAGTARRQSIRQAGQ